MQKSLKILCFQGFSSLWLRGHATTDTDIRFKSRFETSGEFQRDVPPPTPRSEPTVSAVTGGNIAELAATAFVAPLVVLLSVRTIGYRGEQCCGGESVSQSPLKDNAFRRYPAKTHRLSHGPKWNFSPTQCPSSRIAPPSDKNGFPAISGWWSGEPSRLLNLEFVAVDLSQRRQRFPPKRSLNNG